MTGPVLIDLGDLAESQESAGGTARRRGWIGRRQGWTGRRAGWTARRRGWLAAVAALSVLAMAGGAPQRPALWSVAELPLSVVERFAVTGDYAAVTLGGDQDSVIRGYRLPSGAPAWTVRLPGSVDSVSAMPVPGLVAVDVREPSGAQRTVMLDATTGRTLWARSDLYLEVDSAVPEVLLAFAPGPAPGDPSAITALAARTGRVRWTLRLNPDWYDVASQDPTPGTPLVIVTADQRVVAVDRTTGQQLGTPVAPAAPWSARGSPAVSAIYDRPQPLYSMVGATLYATYTTGLHSGWVVAYDPLTLDLRWADRLGVAADVVSGCGPVVCVGDDGQIEGLDPVTGAVRWRADPADVLTVGSGRLVTGVGFPPTQLTVRDAASGMALLRLERWQWVQTDGLPLLVSTDVATISTRFAVVDLSGAAVRYLGSSARLIGVMCLRTPRYLACPTVDRTLRVLRYRA